MSIYSMILCGGSGTRLWPLSRESFPKQFLTLHGDRTLLQQTALRMLNVSALENLRVISGTRWHELVMQQLGEIFSPDNLPEHVLIAEPCARGTAPAILLAVEDILRYGARPDDAVIIAPSDAYIHDSKIFTQALKISVRAAQDGFIATLGIAPTRPETGFGYILQGRGHDGGYFEAAQFVEKPDVEMAKEYLRKGSYFWNSGIFIFTPESLYRELEQADPELYAAAMTRNLRENFAGIKNISFDVAVMEKARRVAVVPMSNSGWSDIGSWDALGEILEHDDNGNIASGDVMLMDCENCFVRSHAKFAAVYGVEDLVIIDSPDALFVTRRGKSQEVRKVVKGLKDAARYDKL